MNFASGKLMNVELKSQKLSWQLNCCDEKALTCHFRHDGADLQTSVATKFKFQVQEHTTQVFFADKGTDTVMWQSQKFQKFKNGLKLAQGCCLALKQKMKKMKKPFEQSHFHTPP